MAIEVFADIDMQVIGDRFRQAREAHGMKKQAVAWRADLNAGHYGELENGKLKGLTLNTFYKLCLVLRVSANDILGIDPAPQVRREA